MKLFKSSWSFLFFLRVRVLSRPSTNFSNVDIKEKLLIHWSTDPWQQSSLQACELYVWVHACLYITCSYTTGTSKAVYCALNTVCRSLTITSASLTYPSPPECIFSVLQSMVHPRKQRHLIGVHSPAKSFILSPFIFRFCSVEREMYHHYWLLLLVTESESRSPNCNSMGG